jgi:SPP1 gp7 family putative phage head morphogenesis protein
MKLSAALLAKYNTQKKKTLDRLTSKHRRKLVEIFKQHFKASEQDFLEALEGWQNDFRPDTKGLLEQIEKVIKEHRDDVIYVGVSDGMQEVRPDNSMGHWATYSVDFPIERSIVSLEQKKKRWEVVKKIGQKIKDSKRAEKALKEIAKSQLDQYLKAVKDAYKKAADEFLYGTGDRKSAIAKVDDFQDFFREVFNRVGFNAERVFRTETTAYFNEARIDYFKDNTDVDFVQIFAITDNRISKICDDRHQYIIPISESHKKKFKPPFHPNCRTVVSPLISYLYDQAEIERNLGTEFGTCEVEDAEGKAIKYRGKRSPPKTPLPVGWA